jgi:predicted TPR repeat methyltransferase
LNQTSGDLIADRRFAWAKASAEAGDHAGAADLLEQIVAMVPRWAPAWAALAEARERLGDVAAATKAWQTAALCDNTSHLGAALRLARLRGETPSTVPHGYVAALFDDYAPRFDRHLSEALNYRGPVLIRDALLAIRPEAGFRHGLDLGCGTGLMGEALRGLVERLDGVDLSPGMVELGRRRGIYAAIEVASLQEALDRAAAQSYDLVTAADVLVYIGALDTVFAGLARVLKPDGLFAASVQTMPGEAYGLGADLRFSHAPAYIAATAAANGLRLLLQQEASTRIEKGLEVPGLVVVATPVPATV